MVEQQAVTCLSVFYLAHFLLGFLKEMRNIWQAGSGPCHQVAKLWSREQHVILTQDGPVESPGGGKTTDPGKQAVACS